VEVYQFSTLSILEGTFHSPRIAYLPKKEIKNQKHDEPKAKLQLKTKGRKIYMF